MQSVKAIRCQTSGRWLQRPPNYKRSQIACKWNAKLWIHIVYGHTVWYFDFGRVTCEWHSEPWNALDLLRELRILWEIIPKGTATALQTLCFLIPTTSLLMGRRTWLPAAGRCSTFNLTVTPIRISDHFFISYSLLWRTKHDSSLNIYLFFTKCINK